MKNTWYWLDLRRALHNTPGDFVQVVILERADIPLEKDLPKEKSAWS